MLVKIVDIFITKQNTLLSIPICMYVCIYICPTLFIEFFPMFINVIMQNTLCSEKNDSLYGFTLVGEIYYCHTLVLFPYYLNNK